MLKLLLLFLFNFYFSGFCMHKGPKKRDIENIIKKLIETKNITSYQNATQSISSIVSDKIIKTIKWNKNNIHLLLLLHYCNSFKNALTDYNIDLLQKRLIEETDIMSYQNAKYPIHRIISDKIIAAMKHKWKKENIHLLLLLYDCDNFEDALNNDNIELLRERLIEETDIMSYQNAPEYISPIVSKKIIEKMKDQWTADNIHLLLLLDYCHNFKDALTDNNIDLLQKRLIEETDIMSYQNAKYPISLIVSEEIIENMKDQWTADNIHLLLLLNQSLYYFRHLLKKHIKVLINKLIKETDIMSYQNATQSISPMVSDKIINTIQWDENNIHLLLLLDNCNSFKNALTNDNIELLRERLIEKTNIMTHQNAKCPINKKISEKIIEIMKDQWTEDNIHLLLLLNEYCDNFKEALTDNIELLIKTLITDIISYQNAKYPINKTVSEEIIKTIKWDQNNIHLLLLLDEKSENYNSALTNDNIDLLREQLPKKREEIKAKMPTYNRNRLLFYKIQQKNEFGFITKINNLAKLQSSLSPWNINEKYKIRTEINDLLEKQIDLSENEENLCKKEEINKKGINIEQFESLDISYGMPPRAKYLATTGFSVINMLLLLEKYCGYNIMENKKLFIPIIGISTLMFLAPIIVNAIDEYRDKENFLIREENKNKIINFIKYKQPIDNSLKLV